MYPIASIAGGFPATLGILSIALAGASSFTSTATDTASQLDRSLKGDRLARNVRSEAADPSRVTVVEVIGVRDTAVVYRDRDGRVLFRSDPVANVTFVAKGAALPEVTVREHSNAVPKKMPVKTLREGDKERLEGCDPLVSPLAGSALSQVAGRCIAATESGAKLALVVR